MLATNLKLVLNSSTDENKKIMLQIPSHAEIAIEVPAESIQRIIIFR